MMCLNCSKRSYSKRKSRLSKKVVFTVTFGVMNVFLFIALVVTSQRDSARDYAAKVMKKAFVAERAIHIIDEAAGTKIL